MKSNESKDYVLTTIDRDGVFIQIVSVQLHSCVTTVSTKAHVPRVFHRFQNRFWAWSSIQL